MPSSRSLVSISHIPNWPRLKVFIDSLDLLAVQRHHQIRSKQVVRDCAIDADPIGLSHLFIPPISSWSLTTIMPLASASSTPITPIACGIEAGSRAALQNLSEADEAHGP